MKRIAALGGRVGVAAACVASALAMVVPAQPAAANYCGVEPRTPFMIDPRLYLVDGQNKASCGGQVSSIIAEAELLRRNSQGTYKTVGYGKSTGADVQYVYADAYHRCEATGATWYQTLGYARFVYAGTARYEGPATSSVRELQCPQPPLPDIDPTN